MWWFLSWLKRLSHDCKVTVGCILGRIYVCECKEAISEKKKSNIWKWVIIMLKYNWRFFFFFACLLCDLMPFFVKAVLWKVSKSNLISLLIYECLCHRCLASNMMFTTSLASYGLFSTSPWALGLSSLLGLALVLINLQKCSIFFFFFMCHSWF